MNIITTTQLRTKTSDLVKTLMTGQSVQLIHRSKHLGTLTLTPQASKPFNPERFGKLADQLNLPKTTRVQRDKIYRKRLMEKYGQYLS